MDVYHLKNMTMVEEGILSIIFVESWFQEEIDMLVGIVMARMIGSGIIEHLQGADRESIRFNWDGHFFVLNFEYYSQSCWIESESSQGQHLLTTLQITN